jgi:hypothetical protein
MGNSLKITRLTHGLLKRTYQILKLFSVLYTTLGNFWKVVNNKVDVLVTTIEELASNSCA